MESQSKFRPDPKLKLMDQVREVLRYKHYAFRTEQTYCNWILRVLSENVCKSIFFAGRGYKNYFVWLERPDKEGWRHGEGFFEGGEIRTVDFRL